MDSARPLAVVALFFVLLALPGTLAAQELSETSSCARLSLLRQEEPAACSDVHLDGGGLVAPSSEPESALEPAPSGLSGERAPLIKNDRLRIGLASGMAVGAATGGFLNAYAETPHHSFRVTNEGFFGRTTYVGGADKASHFVEYAIISKELANLYEVMGFSRNTSIALGFGVAFTTGLLNEIGDGMNPYGFSYEDLTMDALGAATAALIKIARIEDLVGFRVGLLLPLAGSKTCCQVQGLGRDYSNEIYTADLHFAGIADRLHLKVGPLRYLLFSVTYGAKGYPSGTVALRERQVGFEIGLDLESIVNDLGARRNTWWGYALHIALDNFRVPYTSVGYRYDLNHDKWTGPDNGNGFAAR